MAMILSAAMILRWLGEAEATDVLEGAVSGHLQKGELLTPDLSAGTMEVAKEIARLIREAF
jgi:isocitrate/isopropylmalate dehydrogenase